MSEFRWFLAARWTVDILPNRHEVERISACCLRCKVYFCTPVRIRETPIRTVTSW